MTKLFKKFQFPRKQQQARRSSSSVSSGNSSSSSFLMDSTRPSIYLHNKSSRRSGVNKYTCSPRLSLYFQEMRDGPQLQFQRPPRKSSFLSCGNPRGGRSNTRSSSSFLLEDLHMRGRTNQGTLEDSLGLNNDESTNSLCTIGLDEVKRNKKGQPTRFDMGDYLDDNEFSLSMFENKGKKKFSKPMRTLTY